MAGAVLRAGRWFSSRLLEGDGAVLWRGPCPRDVAAARGQDTVKQHSGRVPGIAGAGPRARGSPFLGGVIRARVGGSARSPQGLRRRSRRGRQEGMPGPPRCCGWGRGLWRAEAERGNDLTGWSCSRCPWLGVRRLPGGPHRGSWVSVLKARRAHGWVGRPCRPGMQESRGRGNQSESGGLRARAMDGVSSSPSPSLGNQEHWCPRAGEGGRPSSSPPPPPGHSTWVLSGPDDAHLGHRVIR